MALTIAIEGKGVIANCDGLDDSAGGTWDEVGGGTISYTTDTFLYGSGCIAGAYSNKSGWQQYDLGVGNELDFDVAGAEEGQHIYIWVHCPTIGLLETKANKGLTIRIATDANNYREYLIAGSDDANGWNGGWKCFVIDPTKAGSVGDTGTYDYGSIQMLGIWIEAAAIAKGDNIFIDQISVGSGLRITGTSTTGWKDVVDYCIDYPNRAWGMFQEREGIYFSYGKTWIGDSTQAAITSFADKSRIIQYGISEYWNGSAWVTLADINYSGIVIEDAAGFATTFEDGIIVGTDNGRAGSQFIGNSNHDVSVDLYGGNNAGSLTKLYNTTFKDLFGGITWGNDADHLFYGGVINNCGQFDPVGAPVLRNLTISGYTLSADAALLWNENIDIQDCNFIANTGTNACGIEHPSAVGSPYGYTNLLFDGNDKDVNNTSGSPIEITKTGTSNPNSYKGSTVTFTGAVPMSIHVVDGDGNNIQDAQCAIYKESDDSELMNEDTLASGYAEEDYTGSTPVNIYYRVRKSSTGDIKYIPVSGIGQVIAVSGFSATVTLREDPNA